MEGYENQSLPEETQSAGDAPKDAQGANTGGEMGQGAASQGNGVNADACPVALAVPSEGYPGYPQPAGTPAGPVQGQYPYAPPQGGWAYGSPYGYDGGQPPVGYPPPQGYNAYPYAGGYPYQPAQGAWAPPPKQPESPDPARIKSAKRSAVMCLVFGCVSTVAGFVYFAVAEWMFLAHEFFASYTSLAIMVLMLSLSVTGLVMSIMSRKDLPSDGRGIATAAMIMCLIAIPFVLAALSVSGCVMCVDLTCGTSRCY